MNDADALFATLADHDMFAQIQITAINWLRSSR